MEHTMWKLQNQIKNYAWGSKNALLKLFNIANPDNLPQAEMWMGVHLQGISTAVNMLGEETKLSELIMQDPVTILGESIYSQYKNLPYLFKVLSAESALSIQVHPSLDKAQQGYDKENQLGIALDAPERNYKDPNHKPELIYALTRFLAMNGFRPLSEITAVFSKLQLSSIHTGVAQFMSSPSDTGIKLFFGYLLALNDKSKQSVINELLSNLTLLDEITRTTIAELAKLYPNDIGLFAPLLLNLIELEPGQAMFLKAQTPHAYLKGTGLEIMANSDNVLRAGLTNKHIDVDELLDNTLFESIPKQNLLTQAVKQDNRLNFPVPVSDFAFEIIDSQPNYLTQKICSAEILFCIEGQVTVSTKSDKFTIHSGESLFIAKNAQAFSYQGKGVLARAFNR